MTVNDIISQIVAFRDERDWAQYHTVKNLAAALSIEAGELQESILWKSDNEINELLASEDRNDLTDELADVLIYAFLLAHELNEKPLELILNKIQLNASKYPVEASKGKATKYNRLK